MVTTAEYVVICAGISCSARSPRPLFWPSSRASEIADDDIDGLYSTVALITELSALIRSIMFFEPAPPTMRNSVRLAASIALITPIPWSSSWFHRASSLGADCSRFAVTCSPVSTVNDAETRGPSEKPLRLKASLKPWLRCWVSGSESIPETSAMIGLDTFFFFISAAM